MIISSIRRAATSLLVCVTLFSALAFGLPAQAIEIKAVTSKSGVTAWLVEDHTIPLIAMKYSFKGGSANDPDAKQGLAHMLSAMLDEGAGDIKSVQFQGLIDALAMRMSFSASRDDFTGTFQTLSENRDKAAGLLKLALSKPRFDAAPLERIRNQIVASLKSDAQSPGTISGVAFMKALMGNHPYGRPSKGTVDGVKAVTADDLRGLSAKLFARDNLLVSVVGDITPDQLRALLDEVFGGLPAKSGIVPIAEAKVAKGPAVKVIDRAIPQSVIRFGHEGIKRDDPDYIPAYLMNFILGDGGFNARLTEEVREKRGLSYSVYSALFPLDHAGVLFGGAATVNARASETIAVIRAEFKRMAEKGPTEKELAQAKTYLTGSYALRFDSNVKIANQLLGIQQVNLPIDYPVKRNALVNAVTIEDVRRIAKRLIRADDLFFIVVGRPKGVKSEGNSG